MSLFREQIERRMKNDQSDLEEAFQLMAKAVIDAWNIDQIENHYLIAREALDDILAYYHKKPIESEENFTDTLEHLESLLRPEGLMLRDVKLEDGWQKHAYGPMLGYLKDTGVTVTLLPGIFSGYYYIDCSLYHQLSLSAAKCYQFAVESLFFMVENEKVPENRHSEKS